MRPEYDVPMITGYTDLIVPLGSTACTATFLEFQLCAVVDLQHDVVVVYLADLAQHTAGHDHFVAIKYLIDRQMSVDAVSKTLDFSDRTSFTNAFKRWTGLSPSVFRKLFRDYA